MTCLPRPVSTKTVPSQRSVGCSKPTMIPSNSPHPTLPHPTPPTPSSIPIFSTCQMNQQLQGWADEFGGDFELTIAGTRVVFVTEAEEIRRLLLLRPSKLRRGWTPVRNVPFFFFRLRNNYRIIFFYTNSVLYCSKYTEVYNTGQTNIQHYFSKLVALQKH